MLSSLLPHLAIETSQETPSMMSSSGGEVSSPEFEFWMVGKNPSLPQPSLLTADELFVDGVLLPLHLLSLSQPNLSPSPESPPELNVEPPPTPPSSSSSSPAPPTASLPRKWKDIHKARDKAAEERRGSAGESAELNINLWPFSRSRSAGNACIGPWSRARATVAGRKVSSAPCSRSNSRGESSKLTATTTATSSSSSRRWTPTASRVAAFAGGIHLGRTGPIWKIHKKINQPAANPSDNNAGRTGAKKGGSNGVGVRVLNFHVNTCIGYRTRESCSTIHAGTIVGGRGGHSEGGTGNNGGCRSSSSSNLFKLRAIFSKNVY